MNNELRISAKHLGALALPDFCERCFWLQVKCGWKMPFTFFPGIFSTLDSHVKQVAAAHFAARRHLPPWLPYDLGTPIPVPHWSKFAWRDPVTDILLVGAPDEMVRCRHCDIAIFDYKTARWTDATDALLPLYHVQLNGYGLIAERLGLGRVTSLWLIYCEPQPVDVKDPLALCHDYGFSMHFNTKIVPLHLQPDIIPPLLMRARQIANLTQTPEGRHGCKDCGRLERLLTLTKGVNV